jgi:hypothetical protein
MEKFQELRPVHETIVVRMDPIDKWRAIDGTIHDTEQKCITHENKLLWKKRFEAVEQTTIRIGLSDLCLDDGSASQWFKVKSQEEFDVIIDYIYSSASRNATVSVDEIDYPFTSREELKKELFIIIGHAWFSYSIYYGEDYPDSIYLYTYRCVEQKISNLVDQFLRLR